jgi:hypothetical protein
MAVSPSAPSSAQLPSVEQQAYQAEIERQAHIGGIKGMLDRVANILGGDKTYRVHKDTDGNISVAEDPSTRGEKWGRIAAAALGGAGQGLANSVGPNAPARAAAAGIQTGMQMPEQQRQQVEQQASDQNKLMMQNAQRARLNQETFKASWDNEHLDSNYTQQQEDWAVKHSKELQDAGAEQVATNVTNMDELHKMGIANPLAVGAHLGQNGDILYTEPDGNKGVNVYRIPQAIANKKTTTDWAFDKYNIDPNDPTKTIKEHHVTQAGQDTEGARATAQMALDTANNLVMKQSVENGKSIATKNKEQAEATATPTKTRAEVAHLKAETAQAYAEAKKNNAAAAVGGGGNANQGPFNPNDANDVMASKLADGTELEKGIFTRMPAAQKLQLFARAEALSQQKYGKAYDPAVIAQENTQANLPKTQAYFGATTNLLGGTHDVPTGQLDQLIHTAEAAGIGENSAKNASLIAAASNPVAAVLLPQKQLNAISAYITARNEAKRSLTTAAGNPLVNGSDSDMKLKQMNESIGAVPTLGNLRSQVASIKQSTTQERNATMENNRFLKRRYGAGATAPPPAGGGGPQQPPVPPGKFAHRNANGVIDGYADDTKGTNHVSF